MADVLLTEVQALLKQAQEAHHLYESEELHGERDEQWPAWYADFLLNNGLDELFGSQKSADELSEWLQAAARAAGKDDDWAAFTAAFLIERITNPPSKEN